MKSQEEFEVFYRNDLVNTVQELREDAQEIYNQSLSGEDRLSLMGIAGIFVLLFSPVLIWLWYSTGSFPLFWTVIIAVGGYFVAKKFGIYFRKGTKFKKQFKQKLINKIVHFFDGDFSYLPTGGFDKKKINDSFIFPKEAAGVNTEDYVEGTVGDTDIAFCELIASTANIKHLHGLQFNEDQRKQAEEMTEYMVDRFANKKKRFFKGIYFTADFPKNFQSQTLVRPTEFVWNNQHKNPYKPDRRLHNNLEQVHLEDQELEQDYNVYGTDQQQARYVLSTSMMERIKDFSNRTDKKLFLCFQDSKMHLALPYNRDLLEVNITQQFDAKKEGLNEVIDKEQIFTFYKDINFILGIVKDFNLNTRIWSKS